MERKPIVNEMIVFGMKGLKEQNYGKNKVQARECNGQPTRYGITFSTQQKSSQKTNERREKYEPNQGHLFTEQ